MTARNFSTSGTNFDASEYSSRHMMLGVVALAELERRHTMCQTTSRIAAIASAAVGTATTLLRSCLTLQPANPPSDPWHGARPRARQGSEASPRPPADVLKRSPLRRSACPTGIFACRSLFFGESKQKSNRNAKDESERTTVSGAFVASRATYSSIKLAGPTIGVPRVTRVCSQPPKLGVFLAVFWARYLANISRAHLVPVVSRLVIFSVRPLALSLSSSR